MSYPSGQIQFSTISNEIILGGNFTLSTHGVQPSSANITISPTPSVAQTLGTLTFRYDGSEVVRFRDCAPTQPMHTRSQAGNKMTVRILDRRWRWAYGEINGRYNLRHPKSGEIDVTTVKSPRELAVMLLIAMGETGFDVSRIAGQYNDARPEVNWIMANPANELQTMCESLGLVVVWNYLADVVEIWPKGNGPSLPTAQSLNISHGLTLTAQPSSIKVGTAEASFQSVWRLEAVGKEKDSEIWKLIDDLSYKPTGGWEQQEPGLFDGVTDDDDRKLAKEHVFRAYRS